MLHVNQYYLAVYTFCYKFSILQKNLNIILIKI